MNMSEVKVEDLIALNKRLVRLKCQNVNLRDVENRTGGIGNQPRIFTKFIFKKGILAYSGPTLASHKYHTLDKYIRHITI